MSVRPSVRLSVCLSVCPRSSDFICGPIFTNEGSNDSSNAADVPFGHYIHVRHLGKKLWAKNCFDTQNFLFFCNWFLRERSQIALDFYGRGLKRLVKSCTSFLISMHFRCNQREESYGQKRDPTLDPLLLAKHQLGKGIASLKGDTHR